MMKDIYELLNDAQIDISDLKPEKLSEFEKRRIYEKLTGRTDRKITRTHRKRTWKGFVSIAAVAAAVIGIGLSPVGAAIWSYFNGNTKDDYVEEIKDTVDGQGAAMEVMSISKSGVEIKIKCKFTFDRDISSLAEECADYDHPEGNVLDAPPFKDCTVLVNGVDLKEIADNDENRMPMILSSRNAEINGNVLVQTINILDFGKEEGDKQISLRYKDIVVDGEKIEGQWDYDYTLKSDAYPDEELKTREIGIKGIDAWGRIFTMDSFAVTPNGIKIFGTSDNAMVETGDDYPMQSSLIRILAKDNLGNEYLMYPRYPSGDGVNAIYEIYDGPADANDQYPDEWSAEASSVTVALQQQVITWTSETEFEAEYPVISEEFTIDLTKDISK